MNLIVLGSLIPVVVLIGIGLLAARAKWLRPDSVKDMSTLLFMVLTPALMFRTMSKVDIVHLDLTPIAAYFSAALLLFAAVAWWGRGTRRAAAMAISATFGNTVAIGIPVVSLAYGEAALITLFTVIAVHALILLTLTTVMFEWATRREAAQGVVPGSTGGQHWLASVAQAVRGGILNPATTPTLLGLLFAQSGWPMPAVLDNTLKLLAGAMGPVALILVGAALAGAKVGEQAKGALRLTLLKNALMPLMVVASGWAWGLRGVPLTVLVVAAAMPIGANAFLFSQRYNVAQSLVTAGVALSTVLALLSVSVVMALMALVAAWGG
jgi:predicted permease